MTALLILAFVLVLSAFAILLHCLLSANDTAADRHDDMRLQLAALRADAERRRRERDEAAKMGGRR